MVTFGGSLAVEAASGRKSLDGSILAMAETVGN